MALCDNCGKHASRVRSKWRGALKVDECSSCAPMSFDKHQDPSTKKIWVGPEYMPTKYFKKENPDGGYRYEAKDELRQDTEDAITRGSTDEIDAYEKAVAKKRRERTTELTPGQTADAISFAQKVVEGIQEKHKQAMLDREAMLREAN